MSKVIATRSELLEPELSLLSERDLARLGLATVVLVLDTPHADVIGTLRDALRTAVGDRFHLTGAPSGDQAVGCVLVAPHTFLAELRTLLAASTSGTCRCRPVMSRCR